MLRRTGRSGKVAACAMVFGVSLALAGCGGDPTPIVKTPSADTPVTDAVSKSAAKPKGGSGGSLTEGGELTAQERRAAKLREKSSAAK